jgi:hypothetical protein
VWNGTVHSSRRLRPLLPMSRHRTWPSFNQLLPLLLLHIWSKATTTTSSMHRKQSPIVLSIRLESGEVQIDLHGRRQQKYESQCRIQHDNGALNLPWTPAAERISWYRVEVRSIWTLIGLMSLATISFVG